MGLYLFFFFSILHLCCIIEDSNYINFREMSNLNNPVKTRLWLGTQIYVSYSRFTKQEKIKEVKLFYTSSRKKLQDFFLSEFFFLMKNSMLLCYHFLPHNLYERYSYSFKFQIVISHSSNTWWDTYNSGHVDNGLDDIIIVIDVIQWY